MSVVSHQDPDKKYAIVDQQLTLSQVPCSGSGCHSFYDALFCGCLLATTT